MKSFNTKLILAFMVAATMASCKKNLDLVNPNAQTSATFWLTSDDATKGVNAIYGSLIIDGSYMRFTPIVFDTRGDDATSNSPWDQIYNMGKFSINTSGFGVSAPWTAYYQGIYRANQAIANIPAISMDAGLKSRLMGQAYFMRALFYFHLADIYKNVPMPLTPAQTATDYFVKQQPQSVVWQQVIADLQAAIPLLPTSYASVSGPDNADIGRATKGAAMGYLGKTYLFMQKYTEASQQFKAIIDLGIYGLMSNYRDNFTDQAENNKESIFEVQFSRAAGGTDLGWGGDPSAGWGRTSARAITYGARNFGFTDVQPTKALYNEYNQELTTTAKVDPRLAVTMFYNTPGEMVYGQSFQTLYGATDSEVFCRKYENDGIMPNEYDWRSGINERLMRYADILLMYAECLNELGNTSQAYPYIQMVRGRVGLPDLAVTKPGMTQQQMRDQLAHERFLEFSLEGHRFDDIRRWGWLQDASKLATLKSRDPEFASYVTGREYLPIPQGEIDSNPGVLQNTGW